MGYSIQPHGIVFAAWHGDGSSPLHCYEEFFPGANKRLDFAQKCDIVSSEVKNIMENEEEKQSGYVPRPAWQVWAARVGRVLAILFVVYQLYLIAGGHL